MMKQDTQNLKEHTLSYGLANKLILKLASKITLILKRGLEDKLVSLCLFGSSVRGKQQKGSDIDLLIVLVDTPLSYHKRVKMILPFLEEIRECKEYKFMEETNLQLEPSFLLLTQQEIKTHPSILIDVSYEGNILYDTNDFLKKQFVYNKGKIG